uniref:Uncharacterized protein n=1 Tax=Timema monikensis TaxID=170555 RepID=A0A7R9E7J6_9NEOP|nr:unnamed protein product [Timema monikensis]
MPHSPMLKHVQSRSNKFIIIASFEKKKSQLRIFIVWLLIYLNVSALIIKIQDEAIKLRKAPLAKMEDLEAEVTAADT